MKKEPRSNKWRIERPDCDKEEEQNYLELLQKHFPGVSTFEKHPDAMLNIIFTETYEKVLGPNYSKTRIGKRKEKQIKKILLERMRNKYGRWINILCFEFKNPGHARYDTNFNRVYRIKNVGILYGSPSNYLCGNIFLTSHCLERFEERTSPCYYSPITNQLTELYKTEPTSADIIVALILNSNMEYALKDEFCYLNIRIGVLVIENLGDVFIAKTFLTDDMIANNLQWYLPLIEDSKKDINSFIEFLELETIKIKKPIFLLEEIANVLLNISGKEKD
jgi:hypothetical protein